MPDYPVPVTIPLISTNEPEARLAGLSVSEGQQVRAGELLCTLETTKSTQELLAESDGYIVGLRLAEVQSAAAGELLCYLSDSPDWTPAVVIPPGQGAAIGREGGLTIICRMEGQTLRCTTGDLLHPDVEVAVTAAVGCVGDEISVW